MKVMLRPSDKVRLAVSVAIFVVGVVCLLLTGLLSQHSSQCGDSLGGCAAGTNIGLGLLAVFSWVLCGLGLLSLSASLVLMLIGSISRRQEQQSLQKTLDALRRVKHARRR